MTADKFRDIALSLPEACEAVHMNHPDVRVAGKIFADAWANWGLGNGQVSDFDSQDAGRYDFDRSGHVRAGSMQHAGVDHLIVRAVAEGGEDGDADLVAEIAHRAVAEDEASGVEMVLPKQLS